MNNIKFYILFLFCAHFFCCSEKGEKKDIIAQVGHAKLTVEDIHEMLPNYENLQLSKNQMENFVKHWIEGEVIYQEAIQSGLDKQPEINKEINKIIRDYLINYYIDNIINANISVSPADMETYYQENLEEFRSSEDEYHVKMILVSFYNEAAEIRSQIQGNEDFSQWAQRRSIDGSRVNGGDLGFVPLSRLSPILAKTIVNMKTKELSRPIKSEIGYNLIYLVEFRKKGTALLFESVKSIIDERIRARKREENYHQVINRLSENVDLKTDLSFLISLETKN